MAKGKLSLPVLKMADRTHVVAALTKFANKPASAWLATTAPGANGELPRWSKVNAYPAAEVIDALAAAGPNHCLDAWSFLARALAALLAGDQHAARHFAYYTQLRAALSILASVGVGVFDRTNFVITSAGGVLRVDPGSSAKADGLGTHEIVWSALNAWAQEKTLASKFLEIMRLQGVTIGDALNAIWPSYSPETIAGRLMRIWTLDLARARDDQTLRNQSSYSPHALNPISVAPKDYLKFVAHIWDMCEPTTAGSFNKLDRYLLRESMWENQKLIEKGINRADGALSARFDKLPSEIQTLVTQSFLLGKSEPAPPLVITLARKRELPSSALSMVSRGFLLVRLATGFTYANFVDAGIDPSGGALRAWVDVVGIDRGFWNPATPIAELGDLWKEVQDALEDLAGATATPPGCRFDWAAQSPNGLCTISEAERVGLWSLCG